MANNLAPPLGGVAVEAGQQTTAPTIAVPFVGVWEKNNDYSDVMVTMSCDVSGTLYFDFYDEDGTTPTVGTSATSTFPVAGFTYGNAPFNEFHQATKGPRWFRARFLPDSDSSTFRLNAYFVDKSASSLPLNQSISTDQDASVVRAVGAGVTPSGDFVNARQSGVLTNAPATAPLTSGSTYTSDWYGSSGYSSLTALIATDVVSGSDGISVDLSDDGATVRRQVFRTLNSDEATSGSKIFSIPITSPYFRFVYTNGGTNQSALFVQLTLNTTPVQQSVDTVESQISGNSLATMVRSLLNAPNDSGVYENITRALGGALRIAMNEHEVATPILPANSWKVTSVTATTTPSIAITSASALAGRVTVEIYNSDTNRACRVAPTTASITAGNYRTIEAGGNLVMELGPDVDIAVRSASSTVSVQFTEIADTTV